jgi:hypothetical protein
MIKSATDCKTKVKNKECETEGNGEENKWYVVVRYQDVKNAPVPVYAPSEDCGKEKVCEYSRIKEGYCFEMYRTLPQNIKCSRSTKKEKGIFNDYTKNEGTEIDESKIENIKQFLCENRDNLLMPCPDICCDNQPVILGSINFNEITPNTKIINNMINNWDCRTYVITSGLLQYWMEQLAPAELPLNAIINYTLLKDACEDEKSAGDFFKKICGIPKGT